MPTPEELARQQIDALLEQCGWIIQDYKQLNLSAGRGIAIREVRLKEGRCDCLLLIDRKPVGIDFEKLKYLPGAHDEFPELLLAKGDLLFNRTNSAELVGKTAVFNGNPDPCSFASYLIRVRTAEGCLPNFLSYFINSVFGRAWIAGCVSQQVGQANVNGTKLQALVIPLLPLAEQMRIVAEVERRLSVVEELEAVVFTDLQRATRLRQSILQVAFGPTASTT